MEEIECITIGATTHTVVLLDREGKALRPAILWTDKRTIDEVECYHLAFELDLMEVMTGLGVNTASLAGASFKGPATIESWVGSKDFFTRKMNEKFTMLSEGQEILVDATVHLTELNQPVEIPTP